jgi:branched-chain amino acid transport system permease protein
MRLARVFDRTLVRNLLLTAAIAVVLLIVSLAITPFNNLRLASIAYYFTALAGLTVLTGLNGQISLGHGALMAVGAYTVAILVGRDGWALVPALVAATVVTARGVPGGRDARIRGRPAGARRPLSARVRR